MGKMWFFIFIPWNFKSVIWVSSPPPHFKMNLGPCSKQSAPEFCPSAPASAKNEPSVHHYTSIYSRRILIFHVFTQFLRCFLLIFGSLRSPFLFYILIPTIFVQILDNKNSISLKNIYLGKTVFYLVKTFPVFKSLSESLPN